MSVYEKLLEGETLRVRLKNPVGCMRREPFTVARLLLLGDYYVTESSEWAQFAVVGGVTINGQRRQRMEQEEMQSWCNGLEIVA